MASFVISDKPVPGQKKRSVAGTLEFEVLVAVLHRGSMDWGDKLAAKSKKGELVCGYMSKCGQWLRLHGTIGGDSYVPVRSPEGKQILSRSDGK